MITKALAFLIILFAPAELNIPEVKFHNPASSEKCFGYTIIEFGKAIDCHGDTIKLTRKNGLQVYVANNRDHD